VYDSLRLGQTLEKIVAKGDQRKYHRFRGARWYGGIATGDVVGCNLFCHFCWARDDVRLRPAMAGEFFSAEDSFSRLNRIARSKHYRQLRLSGQEPTIGREHLVGLLGLVEKSPYVFILETNGILIGGEEDYAAALAGNRNLGVRVSLKGASEGEFSLLTGAKPEGFELQLKALRNLIDAGVRCHAAAMTSFTSKRDFEALRTRLNEIDQYLGENIEIEELILYPHVVKRLKGKGLTPRVAHEPGQVPPEQV